MEWVLRPTIQANAESVQNAAHFATVPSLRPSAMHFNLKQD